MNLETTKTKIKGIPSQVYLKAEGLWETFKQKSNIGERGSHSSHLFHLFHIFGTDGDQGIGGSYENDHVLSPQGDIPVIVIEDDGPSHRNDQAFSSSPFSRWPEVGKKKDYNLDLQIIKARRAEAKQEKSQDDFSAPWNYISKEKFLKPLQ